MKYIFNKIYVFIFIYEYLNYFSYFLKYKNIYVIHVY